MIWQVTGEELWQALAYVGFFITLFNLLPVLPLDGGRAMAALSPWVWMLAFAGLVVLTFAFPDPILILILILGGFESWPASSSATRPKPPPSTTSRRARASGSPSSTWALVAVLALGVSETFLERSFSDA